jgi:NTE family protein
MNKKNKKIGLVLGVGAAPGLAHIGVIKSLEANGYQVDCIAGTSMGALIGACYASRKDIKSVEQLFLEIDWKKFVSLMDSNIFLLSKGFVQGEKVKEFLKPIIGDIQFKDLKIPLSVIATDVSNGDQVILNEGSVLDAVRASISIPVIFVPVKINNRYLIDGGSVNPLPVDVVKKMKADFIIASNIVPSPSKRESSLDRRESKTSQKGAVLETIESKLEKWGIKIPKSFPPHDADIPDMFSVLLQAMYASEYIVVKEKLQDADIVITPETTHIEMLDFLRAKEAVEKGFEASEKILKN